MLFWLLVFLFSSPVTADYPDKSPYSIIVEGNRDFEVYVAPPNIVNESETIKSTVPKDIVFGYSASYFHNAKIENKHGGYEPFNLNHKGRMLFYNQDTIQYAWPDCNYREDYKKCSFDNNHWVLETNVTISDEQIVVAMYLYDEHLQMLTRSSVTKTHKVEYAQRQKVTTSKENSQVSVSRSPQQDCSGPSCSFPNGSYTGPMQTGSSTIVEDLPPEKIEFPVRLLDVHFQQASLLLWCSVKINLY